MSLNDLITLPKLILFHGKEMYKTLSPASKRYCHESLLFSKLLIFLSLSYNMYFSDDITPSLKGATRIGFDTCFLYNTVMKDIDIKWLRDYFFPNKSVFFYPKRVEWEFRGLLRGKSALTERQIKECGKMITNDWMK